MCWESGMNQIPTPADAKKTHQLTWDTIEECGGWSVATKKTTEEEFKWAYLRAKKEASTT